MAFSLFPALFDHPAKIRFADQEEDENIELLLRQHWITNVSWIVMSIIGFITPVVLINQEIVLEFVKTQQIPNNIVSSFIILWYMAVLAFAISKLIYWYFNIYIVTNKHLVDIDFINLLARNKTEIRLDDIQSARSRFTGILGPLFNFGNLNIETAAEKLHIEFVKVPKPDLVAERIQDLQENVEGAIDVT